MGVNKVVLGNETIMDITDSTVTPETLAEGVTAYDSSGKKISGTMFSNPLPIIDLESADGEIYTATVPWVTELTPGAKFTAIAKTASTTTGPLLNVNGLGNKGLRCLTGVGTASAYLGASDGWIMANKAIDLMYTGSAWVAIGVQRTSVEALMGTLGVAKGGTGLSNVPAGSYLVGNGTGALTVKTPEEVAADVFRGATQRVVRSLTLEENADAVVIDTDDGGNPFECHALLVIASTMNYEDDTNTFVVIPNGWWTNNTFANGSFPSTKSSAGYYQKNILMCYAIPGDPYNVFAGFNIYQPYIPAGAYFQYSDISTLANRRSITSVKFAGKFAAGSKFTLIEVA